MSKFDGALRTAPREVEDRGPDAPPEAPRFRSRFGGLWTDRENAHELLRGRVALGWVDEVEAARLTQWIDEGYVILEGAVEPSRIDALLDELNRTLGGELPRRRAEWWQDGVKHVDIAGPATMDHAAAKLLDLYITSEAARQVSLHPRVVRFLSLIFERPPMAFQSLTMKRGTQQPVHTDTTFVRVSSALELAASWVALEDVAPGSGELEYYPGSHALEELLFDGVHKWTPEGATIVDDYSERLHAHAQEAGLELRRFRPKKGDVLIWAADLYHGGAQEIGEGLTRRSHVTHYCPVDRAPMYLYRDPRLERREGPNGGFYCGDPWR